MTRFATIWIFVFLFAGSAFAQNPYYDHGSFPTQGSLGSSAAMRAELDLIEAGFAKLPTLAGNGNKVVVVNSAGTALTTTTSPVQVVTAFPASPTTGQLVVVTDDSAVGACDSTAGSAVTLCIWDGSNWIAVSGASTVYTLDTVFDNGKIIDGANSLANAVRIGDGTTPMCLFTDATLGPRIKPCTDSNTRTYIENGFTWCLYDIEGDACMLTVDPNATDNDKYTWESGYRPIKTLSLGADALRAAGAASVVTDTALVSGGLVWSYILTTDSNSDYFYWYGRMPPTWDGGTVTATVTVINVNATPANVYEVDVSGECYPAGTVIPTTISTTGEQAATITFGASGSCGGSACNQNDPASATTAAITVNGTPAGGNVCGFQAQVDATATTETVSGVKVIGMDIHYKIAKGM